MARTPNDDRSDSKNPNNGAYWASESNHRQQTRSDDDDDGWGVGPTWSAPSFGGALPTGAAIREDARIVEVSVTFPPEPPCVDGLYFVYHVEKHGREHTFKVDSATIDDAIRDALAFWGEGNCTYVALYDDKTLHFEKAKDCPWPGDLCDELSSMGDLHGFISEADKLQRAERQAIDRCVKQTSRYDIRHPIKDFGAARAAYDALRQELARRLDELNARGVTLTTDAVPNAAMLAKQTLKASACRTWISDYQQGRINLDPFTSAFGFRQKISAIKP